MTITIYVGADHRGFKLKETLKKFSQSKGEKMIDLGNDRYDEKDDYPDFAVKVAGRVSKDPSGTRGILICGAGVGVDVVANKFKGVRSALVSSEDQAYASRNDDDANVLCLAADFLSETRAKKIVEIWLATPFSGAARHKRRLQKIMRLEK